MNTAYILLGTNLGDKRSNIKTALDKISSFCGNILKRSALYETSPWGITDQSFFLNGVIQIETELPPEKLLELLLKIEKEMGRVRVLKWGERTIDLDILYYNEQVITSENLQIPHPEIHRRKFTLIPLCDIAKDYTHPIYKKTNQQLLESCLDDCAVTKVAISL